MSQNLGKTSLTPQIFFGGYAYAYNRWLHTDIYTPPDEVTALVCADKQMHKIVTFFS